MAYLVSRFIFVCFTFFASLGILASFNAFAQQAPVPVFAVEVKLKPFYDEIESIGTLKANEAVDLMSTVTELVTQVNFTDGQRVQQGDVLVEMDISQELALKAEEASRISEAQLQLSRIEPLVASGAAPKSAVDEQQLALQTAQARLQAIESQIRQRRVIAPFDGVLGLRNISVGALSQPGVLLTTIDDDQVMKLDFSVPERYLSRLKTGLLVSATTKAWPDETFDGKIISIDSRLNPVTRSISVRASLPNPDYKLRPGLLMQVRLQSQPREALVLPEEAISTQGDKHFVMVIQESGATSAQGAASSQAAKNQETNTNKLATVEQRFITIGVRKKGQVEIVEGLAAGERVVLHGLARLNSGTAIELKALAEGDETLQQLLEKVSEPATPST